MEQFCAELEQLLIDLNDISTDYMDAYFRCLIIFIKNNHIPDILCNRPDDLLYILYDELKNKMLDENKTMYDYYLSCRYFTIIDQCDIKIALKNE
jgi:hypothetical protein